MYKLYGALVQSKENYDRKQAIEILTSENFLQKLFCMWPKRIQKKIPNVTEIKNRRHSLILHVGLNKISKNMKPIEVIFGVPEKDELVFFFKTVIGGNVKFMNFVRRGEKPRLVIDWMATKKYIARNYIERIKLSIEKNDWETLNIEPLILDSPSTFGMTTYFLPDSKRYKDLIEKLLLNYSKIIYKSIWSNNAGWYYNVYCLFTKRHIWEKIDEIWSISFKVRFNTLQLVVKQLGLSNSLDDIVFAIRAAEKMIILPTRAKKIVLKKIKNLPRERILDEIDFYKKFFGVFG